jgi:hypothetical protein
MSEIIMIGCDNPECGERTESNDKRGWIRVRRGIDGEIYESSRDCELYGEIIYFCGRSSDDTPYVVTIPENADYCSVECCLKGLGLYRK